MLFPLLFLFLRQLDNRPLGLSLTEICLKVLSVRFGLDRYNALIAHIEASKAQPTTGIRVFQVLLGCAVHYIRDSRWGAKIVFFCQLLNLSRPIVFILQVRSPHNYANHSENTYQHQCSKDDQDVVCKIKAVSISEVKCAIIRARILTCLKCGLDLLCFFVFKSLID